MAVDLDDTALMLRYRDGDVAAFETLYARHRAALFRFVLRQTNNRPVAEDVFQETWGRIIRSRTTYRPAAKFTTYLYHVARNCIIDHFRRSQSQPANDQSNSVMDADAVAAPDNPAARADHGQSLQLALQKLPVEQREAFLLKEEGGFTLDEIATLTGVGRETVKSRLRYALGAMRQCLASTETLGIEDG